MDNKGRKISKYSPIFFLISIIPFVFCIWFALLFEGDVRLFLLIFPLCLLGLVFIIASQLLYQINKERLRRKIKGYEFNGKVNTIIVDLERKQVGLVCFWNPIQNYIFPARNITRVWVDDCKRGFGIGCTERVLCRFTIDELSMTLIISVVWNNQMLPMNHPKVLAAISKAENMAEIISQARSFNY